MLYKGTPLDQILEVLGGGKVILLSINLSWARLPGRICGGFWSQGQVDMMGMLRTGNSEPKTVRKFSKEPLKKSALANT